MHLVDLVSRDPRPAAWAEGDNIPWNDPAFSERMLREHLSQDHDLASRRLATIDRQVDWIHRHLLEERDTKILDLACGPGLYSSRLARLGHDCEGIDYAPASIHYAKAHAPGVTCRYTHEDIRTATYPRDRGLVMLLYGEFNVFSPGDARLILGKAHAALREGGLLLLEPHTFVAIEAMGHAPCSWQALAQGLFSDRPHLRLDESCWDADQSAATRRHWIIGTATGETTRYAASYQAYTNEGYEEILRVCGYREVERYSTLEGETNASQPELMAIVARRRALPTTEVSPQQGKGSAY